MVCNKFVINLYTLFENYLDGQTYLDRGIVSQFSLVQIEWDFMATRGRKGFYGHQSKKVILCPLEQESGFYGHQRNKGILWPLEEERDFIATRERTGFYGHQRKKGTLWPLEEERDFIATRGRTGFYGHQRKKGMFGQHDLYKV